MSYSEPDADHSIVLGLPSMQKARIALAAALRNLDPAQFVMDAALSEADTVIAQSDRTGISARDSMRILELLEHPPVPNARLKAAIAALPKSLQDRELMWLSLHPYPPCSSPPAHSGCRLDRSGDDT